MGLTLEKGNKVTLVKEDGSVLEKVLVGLGWDPNRYDGSEAFDLDASVFMLDASGKVRSTADFIFYNQPDDSAKSVHYTGDNRTGDGDGDDEQILMNLSKVPEDIVKLAITVTIDKAEERNQKFGMVDNAYIRVVDQDTEKEELRYDLTEDYDRETAMVIAEIYRHNGTWKFGAVGQGYHGGLKALCDAYGVEID